MRLDIEIEKGKYRITQSADGRVTLYRNGEYWRVGSKFILALAQEIQSLRKAVDAAKGYMTGGAKLLDRAIEIIETGDQRLLASDGPAGGRPPDITLAEWRELYETLVDARRMAAERSES